MACHVSTPTLDLLLPRTLNPHTPSRYTPRRDPLRSTVGGERGTSGDQFTSDATRNAKRMPRLFHRNLEKSSGGPHSRQ
jgi:hypothetical protein